MKTPKAERMASGLWRVRLRLGGSSRMVFGETKRQAEQEAALIKAKYAAGRIEAPGSGTLSEAYDTYISGREGVLSPSTIAGYRRLQKHTFQGLMQRPVASISSAAVQAEVSRMAKAGKSPKSIANAVGLLKAVCSLSRPDYKLAVSTPTQEHKEPLQPRESDIPAIMEAVRGKSCELPVLLAMCMGLRMSEILGLTWGCVQGDRLVIKQARVDEGIKGTKTYAGTRTLTMPGFIRDLFDARTRRGDSDLVFTMRRNVVYESFQRYVGRAGIQHYRFHDLRHLNTTVQLLLGIDPKTITKLNGWANEAMIERRYGHTSDERKELAAETMNDYFATVLPR